MSASRARRNRRQRRRRCRRSSGAGDPVAQLAILFLQLPNGLMEARDDRLKLLDLLLCAGGSTRPTRDYAACAARACPPLQGATVRTSLHWRPCTSACYENRGSEVWRVIASARASRGTLP